MVFLYGLSHHVCAIFKNRPIVLTDRLLRVIPFFFFQEFPDQDVVHGVQRLQIRRRRGERSTRDRALHPNRVGDHASGWMRREPLYRWPRTTWQGFLYVRLQLCPEVSVFPFLFWIILPLSNSLSFPN